MKRFLPLALTIFSLAALASPTPISAADGAVPATPPTDPNDHPATAVVIKYLNHALRHEWPEATGLITEESLSNVHRGWVARVKNSSRTIDDEIRMVESVGKKSLTEIEAMSDAEFYAAYHKALQKEFAMDADRLAEITESLNVNVLSAGIEGSDLVHILVRTRHVDDGGEVSNLELVSLRKTKNGWRVSLSEQGPKLRKVEEKN